MTSPGAGHGATPPAALDCLPLPLTPDQTPAPQHLGLFWAQGFPPPPAFPGSDPGTSCRSGMLAARHPPALRWMLCPGCRGQEAGWASSGPPSAGLPDCDNLPNLSQGVSRAKRGPSVSTREPLWANQQVTGGAPLPFKGDSALW